MNASYLILAILLCGAAYGQTNSTEVTAKVSEAPTTTVATTTLAPINATEALNCTTTWKFPGKCVLRLLCDNNTPAIDLTPYSLRGAKKICPKNHTCCPLDLIITPPPPPPPPKQKPNDHKFDFDDDD